MTTPETYRRCADLICDSDGLIITAGAGMGVDSGLPDFRGTQGFWGLYPALGREKISFQQIASPSAFRDNNRRAWGFYGHRLKLYRETAPGPGFAILRAIAGMMPHGAFVVTSNVDGHFRKAGFPAGRIWECHGSLHHLQCHHRCLGDVWPADEFDPDIDTAACLLQNAPPRCAHCGEPARPNVLMFGGDWEWLGDRMRLQEAAFDEWRIRPKRPVVIEIGAGRTIQTIRHLSQGLDAPLIRINPEYAELERARGIALETTGLQAMLGIAEALAEVGVV